MGLSLGALLNKNFLHRCKTYCIVTPNHGLVPWSRKRSAICWSRVLLFQVLGCKGSVMFVITMFGWGSGMYAFGTEGRGFKGPLLVGVIVD